MPEIAEHVDPLVAGIYAAYEKAGEAEKQRTYLGASIIGKECARSLWYAFRWAAKEKFDGRMLRLFQSGHLAEPRFVADLRAIGCTVFDVDPATGKQFGFADHGGHARGHMDGCAKGVPGGGAKYHVVEFKTHSTKSFSTLKKDGVKKAKPEHFAQMTWYMGQSGMDRALYLAVNKDTDELYSERITFDTIEYAKIQQRFESIIFAAEPPPKISDDPKYYICNMCSQKAVCHGHKVPAKTCRSCCHSTPEREGDARWSCAKHPDGRNSSIPVDVQRAGCPQHLPLPFLVTYADATDAGEGWIEFNRKDNGIAFIVAVCKEAIPAEVTGRYASVPPIYTSAEISAAEDHRAIGDPGVEDLRTAFPGSTIVG